jgi:DnaK suppressor protein
MPAKTTKGIIHEQEPVFRGEKKKHYQKLVDLRDQLVDQIQAISSHSLSSSKQAGEELADIGSDNFNRDMGLALMTEEGKRVQAIQEAIGRLKDGTYGICMDCEKKIQPARLDALPHAKLCVQCKSEKEKN